MTGINKKNEIDLNDVALVKVKQVWQAFKREHISFKLLCIYFFFEYIRPQTLYPALDILPWAFTTIMLTFLTSLNVSPRVRVNNSQTKLLFIFLFIVFMSGFNAIYPAESWDAIDIVINWVLLYILIIKIVTTEKRFILFVLIYLLFNLKMSQHGAISWMSRGFSFRTFGLVGAPGWFKNSGEYAIQMLIFGSLALSYVIAIQQRLERHKKIILYAIAITGYMAVIGASSRGAQLGLAGIATWLLLKQKNGFKGLLVLLTLAVALYSILPDEQLKRFEDMGSDQSSQQRLAYWEIGIDLTNEFPVLGIGYNNWYRYVSELYPQGVGPYKKVEVQHNIFIQASSELGYIGLVVFILLVFNAFRLNVKTRCMCSDEDDRLYRLLSYGLDAGLIGYLVAGSFVTVLFYPFFWVQMSMIVALHNILKRKTTEKIKLSFQQDTANLS